MQKPSHQKVSPLSPHPIILMLHNIRSMWNVGSIFRTADGACIQKIIITGYTATPPRKEIEKTALGATKSVKWSYTKNPLIAISDLKKQHVKIIALEVSPNSVPYNTGIQNNFPLCLIVGNEVSGIDNAILDVCDLIIEIPQYGKKQSLNVSVATGIALFEMVNQYHLGKN